MYIVRHAVIQSILVLMNRSKKGILFLALSFALALNHRSFAQDTLGSDELFSLARKEAFDNKNYPKAIELSKTALIKSPDYYDIRNFLGRVYTWSNKIDSARAEFKKVLAKDQTNEDALNGIFDLEYWNNNYSNALHYAEEGSKAYPNSEELLIKKVKALNSLGRSTEALNAISSFSKNNPNSTKALEQEASLKSLNARNKVGVGYTFIYNDRFKQNWNLANVSYGRAFKGVGTITFGANYANRFNSNGYEFEAETYPSIAKGLYAYLGGAVSEGGLFPNYRVGFSLYKSLPASFEVEAGMRHLQFSSSTTLYVLGVGRYFGNTFVGLRSFLTPSEGELSKSFNLSGKVFLSDDRNDFFNVTLGTGISPDDRTRRLTDNITQNLKSYKAAADYSKNLSKTFTLALGAGWFYEEYSADEDGNQYQINLGLQKRF